jgi:2-haloacid dehalogenase
MAGSYKPAHGHWERLFQRPDVDRSRHVHVAASAFHDLPPAAELGVPAVWINRLDEQSDTPRAAELTDLNGLADTLDSIVAS